MAYTYVPNCVSIGLFCRRLSARDPKFWRVWTDILCCPYSWRHSEQVENWCTTTNLPYTTASKSFLYSNAFVAKSGAQSLTFKSVTEKLTDRQTDKKLNVFGRPGGG